MTIADLDGDGDADLATTYSLGVMLMFNQSCQTGDLDGDGVVGSSDLVILLAAWGPCPELFGCRADLDGDGTVDFEDLLIVLDAGGPRE